MHIPTIEEEYEYRIKNIVKETLKRLDAEISDFKTTDELLDFLDAKDVRDTFGRMIVEDMTEWTDDWLEQLSE